MLPPGGSSTNALNELFPDDDRLQTIAGLVLNYWAAHQSLPPTLADAAAMADPGQKIELTDPYSNKPYNYVPNVSLSAGQTLLAYASAPDSSGKWGALLIAASPKRGQGPVPAVIRVTEKELKVLLRGAPMQR